MRPILCLVTDRTRLGAAPSAEDAVVACIGAAAQAGVDLIQVREPDLADGELARLVRRGVAAVGGTRARVLVNDRFDVALAAGAHGVHLPARGVPAARVRAAAGRPFLIGRSVHDAGEAARVERDGGLDYIVYGTVFATGSKAGGMPAGLERLAAAAAAVRLPVLAIGGVTLARARDLARSGAAGVAAIGMFASAWQQGFDSLEALVAQWARRWRGDGEC